MRFNSIGCVMGYVKTAKIEHKLPQRKVEFSEAKPKECEQSNIKAEKMEDIKDKIKFGKRLFYDEKVFIRINALDLYEKAMKIEEERDEFRRALANCKTKEETQRIQISKSMILQSETKNKEDLGFITMRLMAMLHEVSDFAKSKEYDELPNE